MLVATYSMMRMLATRSGPRLWRNWCSSSLTANSSIYISTSTSPYFNLSVEDWLFRNADSEQPLLLLYRNDPCIIIGRNQNPWKEINFPALRALSVPFIRRRSGGGTVYHDLGNTNFSIHLPRTLFNRHHTSRLVQRAVVALGINAEVNERNDICIGGFKMSVVPTTCHGFINSFFKYVSGSAYKIVHTRAYHHGTMLISTDLGDLGNLLRNTKDGMATKGVISVRSPVRNLRQFNSNVTHDTFMDSAVAEFAREYQIDPHVQTIHETDETCGIDHIRDGIRGLQTWEWRYGQTPEFTHQLCKTFKWGEITARVVSKHAVIVSCSLSSSNSSEQTWCNGLAESLVGARYSSLENTDGAKINARRGKERDVLDWLKEDM